MQTPDLAGVHPDRDVETPWKADGWNRGAAHLDFRVRHVLGREQQLTFTFFGFAATWNETRREQGSSNEPSRMQE